MSSKHFCVLAIISHVYSNRMLRSIRLEHLLMDNCPQIETVDIDGERCEMLATYAIK